MHEENGNGCCNSNAHKPNITIDVKLDDLMGDVNLRKKKAQIEAKRAQSASEPSKIAYMVGVNVGSATVKAVVVDIDSDQILWQDYQRHDTKQPEKTLEFLKRMESEVGISPNNTRMFITGSGGASIAPLLGAKFVQEVTAVSLAVEQLHTEVNSVIEIDGPDAKIIDFQED